MQSSYSIRKRLLFYFTAVIAVLLSLNVLLIVLHSSITNQYQDINKRLILENRFVVMIPQFIDAYIRVVNGTSFSASGGTINQKDLARYQALREEIDSTMASLDGITLNNESHNIYQGLKNIIRNIVSQCDQGVDELRKGNIVFARTINKDILAPLKPFIIEDTSALTATELGYAQTIQASLEKTDQMLLIFSLILFVVISAASAIFALRSSTRIARPLTALTETAKTIANGDLGVGVNAELLNMHDEIGSLANSFNAMLQKLRSELEKQVGSKEVLLGIRTDRELKMIELKKEIAALKEKLAKLGTS